MAQGGGGSDLLGLDGPSTSPGGGGLPPAPTVDPVPPSSPGSISITDVSASEGAGTLTFTLTRAGGTGASSVTFQTQDGTATAGSDYVATTSKVSFAGGLTTQTVTVSLIDDQDVEGDETFAAVLSPAVNAIIGSGFGTGTILNDDVALSGGTLTIAIGTQGSENPGNATFIVTRSGTTTGTVTVNFATTAGTATAGADFTATSGTLTFASGVTSQTITVPVLADTKFETTERFTVTLRNPGGCATISGSSSIEGRIINDFTVANGASPLSLNTASQGYVFNGVAASDFLGTGVAAGDVNGDGVNDLIIGADGSDPVSSGEGTTYVLFGGAANPDALDDLSTDNDGIIGLQTQLPSNLGFVINGASSGSRSGGSVAGVWAGHARRRVDQSHQPRRQQRFRRHRP